MIKGLLILRQQSTHGDEKVQFYLFPNIIFFFVNALN